MADDVLFEFLLIEMVEQMTQSTNDKVYFKNINHLPNTFLCLEAWLQTNILSVMLLSYFYNCFISGKKFI